jgi:hypothetical protein
LPKEEAAGSSSFCDYEAYAEEEGSNLLTHSMWTVHESVFVERGDNNDDGVEIRSVNIKKQPFKFPPDVGDGWEELNANADSHFSTWPGLMSSNLQYVPSLQALSRNPQNFRCLFLGRQPYRGDEGRSGWEFIAVFCVKPEKFMLRMALSSIFDTNVLNTFDPNLRHSLTGAVAYQHANSRGRKISANLPDASKNVRAGGFFTGACNPRNPPVKAYQVTDDIRNGFEQLSCTFGKLLLR